MIRYAADLMQHQANKCLQDDNCFLYLQLSIGDKTLSDNSQVGWVYVRDYRSEINEVMWMVVVLSGRWEGQGRRATFSLDLVVINTLQWHYVKIFVVERYTSQDLGHVAWC